MPTPKLFITLIFCAGLLSGCQQNQSVIEGSNLGQPISNAELARLDLIVGPDGSSLPPGSGNAISGEAIYKSKCQGCHGLEGEGVNGANPLVGGSMQTQQTPLRTLGSYWPYASTIFDYVRRAMPANAPKSLSDAEVYSVTAYLLFMNQIIAKDLSLDKDNLAQIVMPNAEGFIDRSARH